MKAAIKPAQAYELKLPLRLRRQLASEAELQREMEERRRQRHEYDASFATRAKRMAFIKKLCRRIAAAYQPEKIILFGSHAYGTVTPESDVDLLIVMDFDGHPNEQAHKIRTELKLHTPLDLLVRTPHEIAWRLADGDMFIVQIVEDGKVMYENQHAGMDRKRRK
ncbi:MAG: nucleotidyltransferase domain-containing protein [Acidobacteria bacterium]|nr:nucleotidyltransferase domain-containing protein [Acidobacteriota bacterium]